MSDGRGFGPIVEQGNSQAVVVTGTDPSPVAEYAVEELVDHIEKATGNRLPIASESDIPEEYSRRLFVGDTEEARAEGITPEELPPDTFVIRSSSSDLFVLGNEDDDADPLDESHSYSGTLFGIYELLERYVGVRWLWPGELGTHVPQTATVSVDEDVDETIEPAFRFRSFRWARIQRMVDDYDSEIKRLAFSEEGLRDYREDLNVFVRRHRMGNQDSKPEVGHYFSGWWERHGEENPEWFRRREDGERGPEPSASARTNHHFPMCVSNPDLHTHIVEEDWDGGDELRLGEVDTQIFCYCEDCLAWDEPVPDDPPEFARDIYDPMTSNRYARFWQTIHDMAAEQNPDVQITTFLYWNYLPAPTIDIDLDENVYGEFVPWGQEEITYFPLEETPYEWLKEQWLGWKETGMTMAYRPNYFYGGYVMPHISTHQAGDFFQFATENGMVGYDFDSLLGHWAAKGPMFYVHMRLFADPEQEIEQIREEYFAAFGPAADHVERYFDYWEEYSQSRPGNSLRKLIQVDEAYPPDVFHEAEELLESALEAARRDGDSIYVDRVEFLQAGLEHARLASQFMGTLDDRSNPDLHTHTAPVDDPEQFSAAKEALQELVQFRRDHEDLYIADYIEAARKENRRIDNLDELFEHIDEESLLI